jgi:RNase P protein component
VKRSPDPSIIFGLTVYDRRLNAVARNRMKRRMREAFTRERPKLAAAAAATGVSIEAVLGFRPPAGIGRKPVSSVELHADIARVIEAIISRIRQQWPQQ